MEWSTLMPKTDHLPKFGKDKPPLGHQEASKYGKMGAEVSSKVRKEKKEITNWAKWFLETQPTEQECETYAQKYNWDKEKMTNYLMIVERLANRVKKNGDPNAADKIFKAAKVYEENPTTNVALTVRFE